jgi:alpha-galactosidase
MLVPVIIYQAAQLTELGKLDLSKISQEWGKPTLNRSVDGNALRIGNDGFAFGLGTHAGMEANYRLSRVSRFRAKVGVDAEVGKRGSVRFVVIVDGRTKFDSGVIRGGESARTVDIDLRRAKFMTISIDDAGDGNNYDHADLADAQFELERNGQVTAAPPAESDTSQPIIAALDPNKTEIHAPRTVGMTPGRDFIFRVPLTGKSPMNVSVRGLPKGLSYDSRRNVVSGRVENAGSYGIEIRAKGPGGEDTRNILFVAGENKLAQTPPMGWNSWNVWGLDVNTDRARAAADQLIKLSLADRGYSFVNIDDGWEAGRAANGEILTNEKFPSIRVFTDYVHSFGLKAGIYSSPGPKTCGGYEGSYKHEVQDAQSYAKWGFDYLKYDWCSYGDIDKNPDLRGHKAPYEVMKNALDASGRDIVYSLCQYGMADVYQWGKTVGGQLWRTTGDITDNWGSLSSIGFAQGKSSPYASVGGWNDPDMLVVGYVGWGPNVKQTKLTQHEQVTHITLWSMLAAPLLLGCDLTRMDDFTLAVVGNHDVIDVDQDPLGKAANRVWSKGQVEVWTRPLFDGTTAVAVFNRDRKAVAMNIDWRDIKLSSGGHQVRDLWQRRELGIMPVLQTKVGGHGAKMYKIRN